MVLAFGIVVRFRKPSMFLIEKPWFIPNIFLILKVVSIW